MKRNCQCFLFLFFCLSTVVSLSVQAQQYQINDSFIKVLPLVRSFDKIMVSDGVTLVYNQSNEEGLGASASTDAYYENLDVTVVGDTLKISLKKFLRDGKFKPDYKVYASSNKCVSIFITNAARVIVLGELKVDSLSIIASNASKIDAELSVNMLSLELSSASLAQIEGNASLASILVEDASKFNAYSLKMDTASLIAKGASKIYSTVISKCDVIAEGASKIYLITKPRSFTKTTSGLSKIIIEN